VHPASTASFVCMSLTVHQRAFVLTCLVCTGQGRRLQQWIDKLRNSASADSQKPLQALSALLPAFNETAAFNPSRLGASAARNAPTARPVRPVSISKHIQNTEARTVNRPADLGHDARIVQRPAELPHAVEAEPLRKEVPSSIEELPQPVQQATSFGVGILASLVAAAIGVGYMISRRQPRSNLGNISMSGTTMMRRFAKDLDKSRSQTDARRQYDGRPNHHEGKGHNRKLKLAPSPRPGYDDDGRLENLEDDPRYFPGAELGKAQKAAMGITGLTGRNTASFDPRSTLVRPAMRIYYGETREQHTKELKLDDVVIVPDFFCADNDFAAYERLLKELRTTASGGGQPSMNDLEYVQHIIEAVCGYFSIEDDGMAACVTWYQCESDEDESPLVITSGDFGERFQDDQNCLATLAFGSRRELAFRRTKTDELIFFPQSNGALSLFGRDACLRCEHGMNMISKDSAARGHISIAVKGRSSLAVAETKLATGPGDEGREDAFDGRGGQPYKGVLRPSLRVITAPPRKQYDMLVRHDDVIVVPEFFCAEDDWGIYYELLKEMRASQAAGEKKSEWISWHEGAHLLTKNPEGSETYQRIVNKMCDYFSVAVGERGTRFNWYRDGSDWKPFHHDSAAFNEKRARNQNCTIGVSFGASRELAFRHAKTGELLYFPQKNGMLFYFGRDANITWQHGINALPEDEQDGKGRISIILWGLCTTTTEEDGSPPMLTDETRDGKGKGKGRRKRIFDLHKR